MPSTQRSMADGACRRHRVQIVAIVVTVIFVASASIAVIVYFSHKTSHHIAMNDTKAEDSESLGGLEGLHQRPIYRLPPTVSPVHYDLELVPDIYRPSPSDFTLKGTVVIRVLCEQVTSQVVLHALDLQLESERMRVTSDEDSAAVTVISWQLDIARETLTLNLGTALKKGHYYHIRVSFRAPLTDDFQAVYYSAYQEGKMTNYLAASIFVPTNARRGFPCFDEPALKAEFTLTILRKADFVALSNMPVNSTTYRVIDGEPWYADRFQKSPPMSTYLLTFTVCQFQSREANTSRGYTFRAWARPESIHQTAYALDIGTNVLPFFDDYFGIPFPLPEQEMIALPEYHYGGMEHWGLVGYKETMLLYSDTWPSLEDKQRIATVIVHELGHMWFGDLVTMHWWDDTWLNEGFASYVQFLGVDHIFPAWRYLDQFLIERFRPAMTSDSFEQSRPLYMPVIYPDDTLSAYDSIIYNKGASILRMVKFFLGESTFKKGIQKYVSKYQYGTATHGGLWNSLNEEAEADGVPVNVSDVMLGWTLQRNFPVVTMTKDRQGHMTLRQERFPPRERPENEDYTWDIPFTFATNSTHRPGNDPLPNDVIWLSRYHRQANVSHPSIPSPDDDRQWLLGNVGCYGYYRVNYDVSNWQALIRQLKEDHRKIGTANRAQIIMDSWSLAGAGLLNYTVALETLSYLQKEVQYIPWRVALLELEELRHVLAANQTVFRHFRAFMQKQTADAFSNFDPSASIREDLDGRTPGLVAEAACQYDLKECVALARSRFAHWRQNPDNNTIQQDLRSTFYCTATRHGDKGDWDYVVSQYLNKTLSANERARLRLALTCSRDQSTLMTLLRKTLDTTFIAEEDVIDTLILLSGNVRARHLVWDFVRDNLDDILERFGQVVFGINEVVSAISRSFSTSEHLQQLKQLAEDHPKVQGHVTGAIQQTHWNIRWLKNNMATVDHWLRLQISDSES